MQSIWCNAFLPGGRKYKSSGCCKLTFLEKPFWLNDFGNSMFLKFMLIWDEHWIDVNLPDRLRSIAGTTCIRQLTKCLHWMCSSLAYWLRQQPTRWSQLYKHGAMNNVFRFSNCEGLCNFKESLVTIDFDRSGCLRYWANKKK